MPRVLLLGSEGLLGSALKRVFENYYDVVGTSRQTLDVTSPSAVATIVRAVAPEIIINATAYNGVDLTERDQVAYRTAEKVNAHLVAQLAELSAERKIPLVHYSTDYVFPGKAGEGYTEEAAPQPLNKYGFTKAQGEALLRTNTKYYYLIRLSRSFGPPGASPTAKKSFVDLMIEAVAQNGKKKINLVNEELSCPTYSLDAAEFTWRLLQDQALYGVYHGANIGACSWYELGKQIFALKNLEVNIIPILSRDYPRAAKRPLFSELINTKRPPQRPWQEALKEYLS